MFSLVKRRDRSANTVNNRLYRQSVLEATFMVMLVLGSGARANQTFTIARCLASLSDKQRFCCCVPTVSVQVSAEVATVSLEQPITLKKIHKSTDAEEGIRAAMQHCFLFTGTSLSTFCSVHSQLSNQSCILLLHTSVFAVASKFTVQ